MSLITGILSGSGGSRDWGLQQEEGRVWSGGKGRRGCVARGSRGPVADRVRVEPRRGLGCHPYHKEIFIEPLL